MFSEFSLNCPAPPPEALKTTTPVPAGSSSRFVFVAVVIVDVVISPVNSPTKSVDVIDVAPVTTPASITIVLSKTIC